MSNSEPIRISKKYCKRIETPYLDGWEIKLPDTTSYSGYKLYVSIWYTDSYSNYVEIIKSKNSVYKFSLEKQDREPGKRYTRPKLTFEELQIELAEHSRQFKPGNYPQALAYLKEYANDNTLIAGRTVAEGLYIGGYDKTWFYYEENYGGVKRRRINTHGCKILKYLSETEVEPMRIKLARFNELSDKEYDIVEYKSKCKEARGKYGSVYGNALPEESRRQIQTKLDEIDNVINIEAEKIKQELEALKKYFSGLLKQ